MSNCPNCNGPCQCWHGRQPITVPTDIEVARATSIIADAGGYVVWPRNTKAGNDCTCGNGNLLGEQHDKCCPFYTPF